MLNYLQQILTYFRNVTLNAAGVRRELYELLRDKDIDRALDLMQDRDLEVDAAIAEYNPQTHEIMRRRDKVRKGREPYRTEKLPRTRQRYINEVELFFLLANPVRWKKEEGDDGAYALFLDFLRSQHFDSRLRQCKRLAGAETEAAILHHLYREGGAARCSTVVLARSTGYRLRPLIDQYGNMAALAWGYVVREGGRHVRHWDFQTAEAMVSCRRGTLGWECDYRPNPTGKINAVYYRQPKAWDGAEQRLRREEALDSRTADTNNYFADPIAAATADVIDAMLDPSVPGKMIQLSGPGSRFDYINPPQASAILGQERESLRQSIFFDTLTPDFDFDKMRGLGTLSGAAIRNAMILGYVKRDNRKEVWGELVERQKNVMLAVCALLHPEKAAELGRLRVSFEFAEPFTGDKEAQWSSVAQLYSAGLVSLEQAVAMLSLTDAPREEVERLRAAKAPGKDNK